MLKNFLVRIGSFTKGGLPGGDGAYSGVIRLEYFKLFQR